VTTIEPEPRMTPQSDTTTVTQTSKHWRDRSERSAGGASALRSDEFTPEVARAMAALRAQHRLSNLSCDPAGNLPAEIASLRAELGELMPAVNRRGFMQLTGAAAVFALTGCYTQHPDTLVPYLQQPEGSTIGTPLYYSSTLRDSGHPVPVVVKTYDGRPIKIEGNPDHPLSRGRCDTFTQAALLNLYDPDRVQDGPKTLSAGVAAPLAWADLDKAVGAALGSGGIGLLTAAGDGPASRALIDAFKAAFGDRVLHALCDAGDPWERALRGGRLVWRADRAALMVTLGGDFVGTPANGLAEQCEFGDMRRLRAGGTLPEMGQLIAFEATLSQTGAVADLRVRTDPERIAWVGWAIAAQVAKALDKPLPAGVAEALSTVAAGKPLGEALGLRTINGRDVVDFTAQRLLAVHKEGNASLVYPGATLGDGQHNVPTYQAAYFLNAILGNEGVTVDAGASPESAFTGASLEELRQALDQGRIATLLVVGCNPLYSSPFLAPAFAKAKAIVVLDDRITESAAGATFFAPTLHGLESWGDAEARAGIYSLQQPTIMPLWDCRAAQESLMAFALAAGVAPAAFKQPVAKPDAGLVAAASRVPLWQAAANGVQSWQAFVKTVWLGKVKPAAKVAGDDRAFWTNALARGVVAIRAERTPEAYAVTRVALAPARAGGSFALAVRPSRTVGDGSWLNNPWLQELPDPISKICWDNYLALSPSDAAKLGLKQNDVANVSVASGADTVALKLPVHLQEGQQPGVLETFSGWGRAHGRAGAVADLGIENGFSVSAVHLALAAAKPGAVVTVTSTGATYHLACAQGHQRMDGREIVIDDVLELHRADPGAKRRRAISEHEQWERGSDGKPGGRLNINGQSEEYPARKWGMSVDLGTCIGCNACVVACSAENNVPVVGRDEVRKQRLMHWIRIDRYYSDAPGAARAPGAQGDDQLDVEVAFMPVMCQQCGQAPCEDVCPAMATVHNDEGINHMIYNRCIGTRYCSNNCPYKVRRFNWYEYSKFRAGPVGSDSPLLRIVKNVKSDLSTSSQAELSKHPLEMLLNPEVTVRSRGVMEKCNFCLQRTRQVREREKASGRRIKDGEVTSACAQTCPTQAIVFGDLRDPEAAVNAGAAAAHGYKLLDEELNTRPAVTYLAKLRDRPASAAELAQLAKAVAKPAAEEGVSR
jgi:molybdopterin-containing oxidoreductase family iron-sulfur binding subunit